MLRCELCHVCPSRLLAVAHTTMRMYSNMGVFLLCGNLLASSVGHLFSPLQLVTLLFFAL